MIVKKQYLMCGILAILGKTPVAQDLLQGLERISYRGYDSAGFALWQKGEVHRYRATGPLLALKALVEPLLLKNQDMREGTLGLAHTRWATHGAPSVENTHPHCAGYITLIHNGILENYGKLRAGLLAMGKKIDGETDTLVIAHLFNHHYAPGSGLDGVKAMIQKVWPLMEGSFALVFMVQDQGDRLYAIRQGNTPLVLGLGLGGQGIVTSDVLGCAGLAQHIAYTAENTLYCFEKHDYQKHGSKILEQRPMDHHEGQENKNSDPCSMDIVVELSEMPSKIVFQENSSPGHGSMSIEMDVSQDFSERINFSTMDKKDSSLWATPNESMDSPQEHHSMNKLSHDDGPLDRMEKIHNLHLYCYTAKGAQQKAPEFFSHPFGSFSVDKGEFQHYMLKEIYEQPAVLHALLHQHHPTLEELLNEKPNHVTLLGCGTSFYAAWTGKYFLEHFFPTTMELASEFHYRRPPMVPGITIALSQSGETIDTLNAASYAKEQNQHLLALINAPYSALGRLAHWTLETQAGPELSVASTKSFTAQLLLLLKLAGFSKDKFYDLSGLMEHVLLMIPTFSALAKELSTYSHVLFLGRGPFYPIALEAALKMKELSYIHAEGIPSGELKHGPLAMIDAKKPVIFFMPFDDLFFKNLSNLHELAAHNGNIWVITNPGALPHLASLPLRDTLVLPQAAPEISIFLYALVAQLLPYYTALYRGCSIDQPRHLAKSITVE